MVTNGEEGDEVPTCSVTVPPALPVRVTSGPLSRVICVPGMATISKLAAPYANPNPANITLPVDVRTPAGDTITVPPELVAKKAPKRSPCEGFQDTDIGRGGGCCALAPCMENNKIISPAICKIPLL